jgi:hypothetical protein
MAGYSSLRGLSLVVISSKSQRSTRMDFESECSEVVEYFVTAEVIANSRLLLHQRPCSPSVSPQS